MREKTLRDIDSHFAVASQALAEVMQEPADGLTIHQAHEIGRMTTNRLRAIEESRKYINIVRFGVAVDVE